MPPDFIGFKLLVIAGGYGILPYGHLWFFVSRHPSEWYIIHADTVRCHPRALLTACRGGYQPPDFIGFKLLVIAGGYGILPYGHL